MLTEIGKRLAERWVSLLALPGVLYLGVLAAAYWLGRHPWAEARRMTDGLDKRADALAGSTVALVVALVLLLLVAAACGLAAQALGSGLERIWYAQDWPGWWAPARKLARWHLLLRRKVYLRREERYGEALAQAHAAGAPAEPGDRVDVAGRRLARMSSGLPQRPTWMADRLHVCVRSLRSDFGLDVGVLWPHLWLLVPEDTRKEVLSARETMNRAAVLGGWAVLCLAVGLLWWPGFLLSVTLLFTSWRRARAATDAYASLAEAVVRLHAPELARHLCLCGEELLDDSIGSALTRHLSPRPRDAP